MIRLAEWLVHLTYAALFGSLGAVLLLLVRRFVTVRAGPRYTAALWIMLLSWMGVILLLSGRGRMRFNDFLFRHDLAFLVHPLLSLDFYDRRLVDGISDGSVWARLWLRPIPQNWAAKGEASRILLVCFAVWLLGLLLFWLLVVYRYRQAKRTLRHLRTTEDPEIRELLRQECLWLGIRGSVEAFLLPASGTGKGIFSPCVMGFRDPVLLLPGELWGRLHPEGKEAVVAHELMHIRRRDNLRNLILLAFHSVFWFAPPIHIALRACRQDLEYLRDAQVLGETATRRERRGYMEAILSVAEECARHYCPTLHSGMFTGSGAGFRLRLLEKETKQPVRTALGRALWVLTALAFPAVIVVFRGVVLLQA